MYIGHARDSFDVQRALELATRTFRWNEKGISAALETTRSLMFPFGAVSRANVIVLIRGSDDICGTCFLIDREFYRGSETLIGTFLSSICIAESSRGKGLSKLLMNEAIKECKRRGSAFAILIARKAVDHFYNIFSFWGLSQYSKIEIQLTACGPTSANIAIAAVTAGDIKSVSRIYESIYSGLYGSCVRSVDYWKHVLWKIDNGKIKFSILRVGERISGYAIYNGDDIYEFAAEQGVSSLDLLKGLMAQETLTKVTLHAPIQHQIVSELRDVDFTVSKRQCSYGGHMVRVINPGTLLACIRKEIFEEVHSLGINELTERHGDTSIKLWNAELNVTLAGSPFDFENTLFLMGAECLSTASNQQNLYKQKSFNVPLLDQV